VNSHLVAIPCLRSLTARGLPGRNFENLGWESNGALDTEIFRFRSIDQLFAYFFQRLDLARRQGDSDSVDLGSFEVPFVGLVVAHTD